MMELISNIFPKISMMLGALVHCMPAVRLSAGGRPVDIL